MNNLAEHPTTSMKDKRKGRARELPTDKQVEVLDFLVEEAAGNDSALEEAIVITVAGMRDKSIQADVGQELLAHLFAAFRDNDHMHDVLQMLRDNAVDFPLAEIERIRAARRKAKNGAKA